MKYLILLLSIISYSTGAEIVMVKTPLFLKGHQEEFSGEKLDTYQGPRISSINTLFISDYPIFESWFHDSYILTNRGLIAIEDTNALIESGILPKGTERIPSAFHGYSAGLKHSCTKELFSSKVYLHKDQLSYSYSNLYHIKSLGIDFLFTKAEGLLFSDFVEHIYKIDNSSCTEISPENRFSMSADFSKTILHKEVSSLKGLMLEGSRELFFWDGGKTYSRINGASYSDFGKYFFMFGSAETGNGFVYSNNGLWELKNKETIEKVIGLGITNVDGMFDIPNTGTMGLFHDDEILIIDKKLAIVNKLKLKTAYIPFEAMPLTKFGIVLFRYIDGIYAIGEQSNPFIQSFLKHGVGSN